MAKTKIVKPSELSAMEFIGSGAISVIAIRRHYIKNMSKLLGKTEDEINEELLLLCDDVSSEINESKVSPNE